MSDTIQGTSWWGDIMRRARARDVERVLLYDRSRRRALQAWLATQASPSAALFAEYFKTLLGAVLGFWLLAWPATAWLDVSRGSVYAVLGLVFSLQVTHHKVRLARDPGYTVRRCNCGGSRADRTEVVLASHTADVGGVPVSLLGAALYAAVLLTMATGQPDAVRALAVLGLLASGYLGWVMVTRIGALCSTCINVAALNVLLVVHVLR